MAYIVMPRRGRHGHCGGLATSLTRGRSLFRLFHRYLPSEVVRARCRRRVPKVLVNLGRLRALVYSSDKDHRGDPRTYIHFMEEPPRLTCDPSGTQLYIVGGGYRVTPRGIEG